VNGCKGSGVVTVNINPLPIIGATVTKPSICIGDNTQLNGSGGVSYSWSPIGNLTPTVTITPANTGNYTYTVTGTDAKGCVNTATTSFTVNPLPTPTITSPVSVCTGTPTTLTAGGGVSYSWAPGGQTGSSINITPTSNGSYTVTVTDANGCVATTSTTITVNPFLTVSVQPGAICVGQSIILNAVSSGATNFSWSTGALTQSINVNPATTTIYTVNVSNNFGCNGSTTTTVTVNPLPVVNVSPPAIICIGQSVTLTANGGSTYNWIPSTGGTLTGNSNTVSPTTTTTYNLTVTDANSCSNTASTSVTVNPLPVVTISPPIGFCQGNSIQLTAGGGVNYVWNPGGLSGPTITVSPSTTTTYNVDVIDINGCTGNNSVVVTIFTAPMAYAGPDLNICIGETTQLHPSGISSSWDYVWNPPTYLSNANIPGPIFSGPVTTTYTLTVSATNSNCPPATDTVTVTVHPIPFVDAGRDTSILAGSEAHLIATSTGSINWYPPSGLSCTTCFNPIASPLHTTTYIVTTVDANGCRNRDTVVIYVEDIITLYVPNAFTPYHDGRNQVFYAFGIGIYDFDFYIFNRWGELIFETHDTEKGWDGSYKGKMVQDDVYVWLAKAKSITGKSINRTGSVTIVR
jgi:gliding motility-associated-like protein